MTVRLPKNHTAFRCGSCGNELAVSKAYCSSSCKRELLALKLQLKYLGSALDRVRSKASFLLITDDEIYLFAKIANEISCRNQVRARPLASDSIRDLWLDLNEASTKKREATFFNGEIQLPEGFLRHFRNKPNGSLRESWWTTLLIDPDEWEINAIDSIKKAYWRQAKLRHPDKGGDTDSMDSLYLARDAATESLTRQTSDKPKKARKPAWKYWKEIGWWVR